MFPSKNRREFLKTLAAGAAGFSLLPRAFAQGGEGQLATTEITDNFTLISGAGSNVLVLNGPEGALLVDGGLAEHSADLVKTAGRVQALFNTHWHPEVTGSNETLGKSGAKIIAHENTKLW